MVQSGLRLRSHRMASVRGGCPHGIRALPCWLVQMKVLTVAPRHERSWHCRRWGPVYTRITPGGGLDRATVLPFKRMARSGGAVDQCALFRIPPLDEAI